MISLLTFSKTYPKQVAPIAMNRKERREYDYNEINKIKVFIK